MHSNVPLTPIPQNDVLIAQPAIQCLLFWLAYIAIHDYYCFPFRTADLFSHYTAVAIGLLCSNLPTSPQRSTAATLT